MPEKGLIQGASGGVGKGALLGAIMGSYKGLNSNILYNFQPETIAWRNQLPNPKPSFIYLSRIDYLIKTLKEQGIWSQLDRLWIFATEQQSHARVSLVNPGGINATWPSNILENNSPTWTRLKGYTGNGTNAYLNTQYIAKNSQLVSLGNISYLLYCVSNETETAGTNVEFGNINRHVVPAAQSFGTLYDGTNSSFMLNATGSVTNPSAGARGTWAVSNAGNSTKIEIYKNGIGSGVDTVIEQDDSSGGTDNQSMYVLAGNFAAGNTAQQFSTQQLAMFGAGTAKINQTEFYNIFNVFVLQNQL